jgi:hypothetical protein
MMQAQPAPQNLQGPPPQPQGPGQFAAPQFAAPQVSYTPPQMPQMAYTPPQAPQVSYTPPAPPQMAYTPPQAPQMSGAPVPAKAPVNWLLIAIIGLVMFIAGAVIVMLLMKPK